MIKIYSRNKGLILFIFVILAFALGILTPQIFKHLNFISILFINLIKLCVLPIILTSLILTIGELNNIQELKNVARNSLIYMLLTEIIAVTIGLTVFNLIDVSHNVNANALLSGVSYSAPSNQNIDISNISNYIFSANIFQSLSNYDILPVVVFSILFGITVALNYEKAKPVMSFLKSSRFIFFELLNGIMYLAPPAIFVLIGSSVAESYTHGVLSNNMIGLGKFVALFLFALFIHFMWQLTLLLFICRELKIKIIFFELIEVFTTAFVSSSSLVTLPVSLEAAARLGGNSKVVNFMLPLCASMNLASGMMYEICATLFFLNILGIHPDMTNQIILGVACIINGIAIGGIPETSMVSFIAIFKMANIPLSAIGVLMPLDRILDRIRTIVNVFGNSCGVLIVSKTIKD
jgi:Na+/H+-dicarboxylate symporter